MEKLLNGKAIYSPKGKAGEYAKYACNFYVGCSNDCDYCYCKRGLLGHAMGAPVATLKKCFKDEAHAFDVFRKEVKANLEVLRKHGLFFTFTSDPMLDNTRQLTINAVGHAVSFGIPCKILTKRADFIDYLPGEWFVNEWYKSRIAFGFTLTGMDEMERGASTNAERIAAMKRLHIAGFRTFASIEPIINLNSSTDMIKQTIDCCDLYKIGLMSGKRNYTREDVAHFVVNINDMILNHNFDNCEDVKVYWKDSVLEFLNMDKEYRYNVSPFSWRFDLSCNVDADYNIFNW